MEQQPASEPKPKRLYFETYVQLIRNAVGTEMFRNFYIQTPDGQQRDALDDGSNSCAFFVSSVLTLMGKHSGPHGTIESTVADLEHCGWQRVGDDSLEPGDVLVWEAIEVDDGTYEHIGFYLGDGRAVSTSWTKKCVVEHDAHFEGTRAITHTYRQYEWDQT